MNNIFTTICRDNKYMGQSYSNEKTEKAIRQSSARTEN